MFRMTVSNVVPVNLGTRVPVFSKCRAYYLYKTGGMNKNIVIPPVLYIGFLSGK